MSRRCKEDLRSKQMLNFLILEGVVLDEKRKALLPYTTNEPLEN
jgi:hypothetical protein